MRRQTLAVAACTSLALALSSCTPAAEGTTAPSLRLAESSEYTTLNPLEYSFGITSKLYDSLVAVGADGRMVPELAVEAPVPDEDMTRWTVRLRDDVTFSDGSTFDAQDVVAGYEAILAAETASPLRSSFEMLTGVTAVDATTVVFELAHPYAAFPTLLTVGIPAAEHVGGTVIESDLNREPVGSGPYRLDEWRAGDSLTLVSNPDYWAGAPEVERIVIAFVPDENARAQRLRAGELDGAQLSPLTSELLDGVDGLEVHANPTADYRAISLPTSLPFFASSGVRTALNLAVDRDAMVSGILAGHGEPASTPFSAAQGTAYDPAATFDHDTVSAAQMLDAEGWRAGADGIRAKDGTRFSFPLMYFADDALRRDLAQAFASDLAPLGVEVTLEAVDRPQAVAGMETKAFVLGGGDMPYDPDTHVYSMLHSDFAAHDPDNAYANPGGYANPAVDALLDEARRTLDQATRDDLYHQLQAELVADPPMVTLVTLEHTYVAAGLGDYTGITQVVEPHEHGVSWGPWWNIETWRSAP